ncbi:hypothetical protein OXYTRIMIC_282 [Oxytricha trifallax]|uniref:Uncharacterized protein n=1 Tax=Oxytricha trifallax TaxID=1172189 RepID=A0A073HWL9_9SPIT|nr:hypothetical protein OXYTRIMIC_282 [Oxytricha trifallax]
MSKETTQEILSKKLKLKLNNQIKKEICGKCGKLLQILNQRKDNNYQKLENVNDTPRSALVYIEQFENIQWDENKKRVKICYQCSKTDIQDYCNERTFPQPEELKRLTTRQQQYAIMLGNIHSYIENKKGGSYYHLLGDQDFTTYDGSIHNYFKELRREDNWWHKLQTHEKKNIGTALSYLKEKNHLFKIFYCNWEIYHIIQAKKELREILENSMKMFIFSLQSAKGQKTSQIQKDKMSYMKIQAEEFQWTQLKNITFSPQTQSIMIIYLEDLLNLVILLHSIHSKQQDLTDMKKSTRQQTNKSHLKKRDQINKNSQETRYIIEIRTLRKCCSPLYFQQEWVDIIILTNNME